MIEQRVQMLNLAVAAGQLEQGSDEFNALIEELNQMGMSIEMTQIGIQDLRRQLEARGVDVHRLLRENDLPTGDEASGGHTDGGGTSFMAQVMGYAQQLLANLPVSAQQAMSEVAASGMKLGHVFMHRIGRPIYEAVTDSNNHSNIGRPFMQMISHEREVLGLNTGIEALDEERTA